MRLYRLIYTSTPTRANFVSNAERGKQLRPGTPPETARLWDGLSMYETLAQALETAARFPTVWRAVAEMEIPTDGTFRVERTTVAAGHWTVWGEPNAVMAYTRRYAPIHRE